MRPTHLLVAGLLACPQLVAAQQAPVAADRRPWVIVVYLGSSSGGPARDLEAAMSAGGYTQPFGGCDFLLCVPETPSPSAYSHANPLVLSISRRLRAPYAAELLIGQAASGTVSGRREDRQLHIEYGGTFVAPLVAIRRGSSSFGAGPALLRGGWTYHDTSDGRESRETTNTLGWIGHATVGVPIGSVLRLQATGQYRGFGTTTVRGGRGGFPAARVNGSHWYAAGGLGVTL